MNLLSLNRGLVYELARTSILLLLRAYQVKRTGTKENKIFDFPTLHLV